MGSLPDYTAGRSGAGRFLTVVAARDLPAYTVLQEDMVKSALVPGTELRRDAYVLKSKSDIRVIYTFVTIKDIRRGAQITESSLLNRSGLEADPGAYREPARQRYLEGLEYFNNADYQNAIEKWWLAKTLDPSNAEAAAAFKRAERMLIGRKRGK